MESKLKELEKEASNREESLLKEDITNVEIADVVSK